MIKRSACLTGVAGLMVTALLLTGCQQKKKGGFTVEGSFKNADKLSMMAGLVACSLTSERVCTSR